MSKAYVPQPGQRIAVKHSDGTVLSSKGALGATFNSAGIKPKGANRVGLYLNITATSGTNETFTATLEVSFDNGTTWVAMPASANSQTQAALAAVTTVSKVFKWWELASDPEWTNIRAVFTIGGTSPTFTFGDSYWLTDFVAKG